MQGVFTVSACRATLSQHVALVSPCRSSSASDINQRTQGIECEPREPARGEPQGHGFLAHDESGRPSDEPPVVMPWEEHNGSAFGRVFRRFVPHHHPESGRARCPHRDELSHRTSLQGCGVHSERQGSLTSVLSSRLRAALCRVVLPAGPG